MRTFHLDRVSDLALTDIPITHGQETVPGWFADTGDDAAGDVNVTFEFPASVAPLFKHRIIIILVSITIF